MKQRWEAEKTAIAAIRGTKSELENLQRDLEGAEREASFGGGSGLPACVRAALRAAAGPDRPPAR